MASGVLVLTLGEACKLSSYLTAQRKRYRAVVRFGTGTDTLDADGTVVESSKLTAPLDEAALAVALAAEAGRSRQEPPAHSAVKVSGVRAYRLARRGAAVPLEERAVSVHALALLERSFDSISVELDVSKGYYVRAFARDLGRSLGVPAHLAALRRLASGTFACEDAVAFPLQTPAPLCNLAECARRCLPVARLNGHGTARARQGKPLSPEHFAAAPGGPVQSEGDSLAGRIAAWLDDAEHVVALGREHPPGCFRVVRGFQEK